MLVTSNHFNIAAYAGYLDVVERIYDWADVLKRKCLIICEYRTVLRRALLCSCINALRLHMRETGSHDITHAIDKEERERNGRDSSKYCF